MTDQPTESVPSSEPAEDYPQPGPEVDPDYQGDTPDEVVEPEGNGG